MYGNQVTVSMYDLAEDRCCTDNQYTTRKIILSFLLSDNITTQLSPYAKKSLKTY